MRWTGAVTAIEFGGMLPIRRRLAIHGLQEPLGELSVRDAYGR